MPQKLRNYIFLGGQSIARHPVILMSVWFYLNWEVKSTIITTLLSCIECIHIVLNNNKIFCWEHIYSIAQDVIIADCKYTSFGIQYTQMYQFIYKSSSKARIWLQKYTERGWCQVRMLSSLEYQEEASKISTKSKRG